MLPYRAHAVIKWFVEYENDVNHISSLAKKQWQKLSIFMENQFDSASQ